MKVSQSIIFRRNERYVKYNETYCRDTTATKSGTNSTSHKWQPASAVHGSYKLGSAGMASDNATVVGKSNMKSKSRRKKKIRGGRHGKAGTKLHVGIWNILYANVNGFRSKYESIKQILVEQDVDVLLLTETKVYKT